MGNVGSDAGSREGEREGGMKEEEEDRWIRERKYKIKSQTALVFISAVLFSFTEQYSHISPLCSLTSAPVISH